MIGSTRSLFAWTLVGTLLLPGCGHRAEREATGRAILLEKAETEAATKTSCDPSQTHAGFTAEQTIGVHACGQWLEYEVRPTPCSGDFFLRRATFDAAEQCSIVQISPAS